MKSLVCKKKIWGREREKEKQWLKTVKNKNSHPKQRLLILSRWQHALHFSSSTRLCFLLFLLVSFREKKLRRELTKISDRSRRLVRDWWKRMAFSSLLWSSCIISPTASLKEKRKLVAEPIRDAYCRGALPFWQLNIWYINRTEVLV